MARLSIGDRVSDQAGAHEGKIVDIDGKMAYVMQANGVEIEFALDRLKPYEEPAAKTVRTLSGRLAGPRAQPGAARIAGHGAGRNQHRGGPELRWWC